MKIYFINYNAFTQAWTPYAEGIEFVADPKDADIIYCSTAALVKKALKIKDKYNKELVCWLWDVPLHQKTWANKLELLKQCDLIISASRNTQKELLKFGLSSEQVYFYHEIQDVIPYQENESNYFVQISRYAETKRFEISIDAFEGLDLNLACVGFQGVRQYYLGLRRLAGKNVSFSVGMEHAQKLELLKNSIGLLSPSVFEGWGLSPMESIACGRPVILSDTPIFREIYGDAVLYHKVDDVEDLRDKIFLLTQNEYLQRRIVDECQKIIKPFTPQEFAKRISTFLNNY